MKNLTKLITSLLFIFSLHITLYTLHSFAAIPHLINYQGRLTDKAGKPLDGAYNLTFKIYDAETAGNLLWEEVHQGAVIQKGIFSVLLGSLKNLNLAFDKPYYLEIKVGNEVMGPRQQIASLAYAISAERLVDEPLAASRGGTGTTANANTANGVVVLDANGKLPSVSGASLTGISGNFKVSSFTKDLATASGKQSITGLGFQPKAVLFSMVNDSRSAGSINGFDDGANANCVWWDFNSIDNMWFIARSYSIYDQNWGIHIAAARTSSFDPDGFTIFWTRTNDPSGTATISYIAYK